MATVKDIAALTGVSPATISRVLNNNSHVSEDKRRLVLDAIVKLNYEGKGRGQINDKRKPIILAVTSRFGFWEEMYNGIYSMANDLGYALNIYYQPYGMFDLNQFAEDGFLFSNQIAGILMANKEIDQTSYKVLSERFPVVFCGQYFRPNGACSVSTDDFRAAYEITEHLIQIGKTRIAVLSTSDDFILDGFVTLEEERIFGYRRALEKFGIEFDDTLILKKNLQTGRFSWDSIMTLDPIPDAFLSVSSSYAFDILQQIYENGYRIPDDFVVAGFNNDRTNNYGVPQITTIHENFYLFGKEAVVILNSMIKEGRTDGRKVYIDHELQIHDSTVKGSDK